MNTYKMWGLNPFLGPLTGLIMEILCWPLGAIDKIFSYKSTGFRLRIGFAAVALLGFYAAWMTLWAVLHPEPQSVEVLRGLLFYAIGLVLYHFLIHQLEKKFRAAF